MAASRGIMSSTRDSSMLHLYEERVIPPLSEHMYACIDTLDWREKEEAARPLSLLINPNRNRKAESKLHNYTGLYVCVYVYVCLSHYNISYLLFSRLPIFRSFFYSAAFS